jgi:hypothetical protein
MATTSAPLSATVIRHLALILALLAAEPFLPAQIVVSTPTVYTFKSSNGGSPTLVMTADVSGQTGNNNSTDTSAILTAVNSKPAVPTLDLGGQLGWQIGGFFNSATSTYYANGQTALAFTFTALADKKQTGTTAAFTVIFDTTGDGVIDSNDRGLALNVTFSAPNSTVTITQTSLVSFSVSASNGAFSPASGLTVGNVNALTGYTANINGSTTGSGTAADGASYTVSLATTMTDVSSTWQPVLGTPTVTTAFSSSAITTAGTVNAIDWYGTSGTTAQTAMLNIPEPSTWLWSVGVMSTGLFVVLRRRRRHLSFEARARAAPYRPR